MNERQREELVRKFRTIKRREIKSQLSELKKKNDDLFKLWAYEKAIDESHLRKSAREILIEIDKLEIAYDRAASDPVTDEMIVQYGRKLREMR